MATWTIGTTETITWSMPDVLSDVKIELSRDNGDTWETIDNSATNDGSYDWVVTGSATSQALIKVSGKLYTNPDDDSPVDFTNITDTSDTTFEIVAQSDTLTQILNIVTQLQIDVANIPQAVAEYAVDGTLTLGDSLKQIRAVTSGSCTVVESGNNYIMSFKNNAGNATILTLTVPKTGLSRVSS
jgi:hypothetical protein